MVHVTATDPTTLQGLIHLPTPTPIANVPLSHYTSLLPPHFASALLGVELAFRSAYSSLSQCKQTSITLCLTALQHLYYGKHWCKMCYTGLSTLEDCAETP